MFKTSFKYYKSKFPPPDMSDVLDFSKHCTENTDKRLLFRERECILKHESDIMMIGLKPVSEWKMYEIVDKPGLLFIQNPFTAEGQRYWVCRCLRDFPSKPLSRLNLDAHGDLAKDEDWWEVCQRHPDRNKALLSKLRWATLGYHHNWDTKVYSEDARNPFPADLAALCRYVARAAGFDCFAAQAAIINFYHMDSTLSGHTDHSEQNREAPLFSFSFGQSAIFLLGGPSVEDKPAAMFLRSGDIVIMSGPSRLCYHGVPRILPAASCEWDKVLPSDGHRELANQTQTKRLKLSHEGMKYSELFDKSIVDGCVKEEFWKPFRKYLSDSRINMNVRQVLYPDQKCLTPLEIKP
ncbi:nucleic acid dioxygenase ALKBH1 [Anabrus simplex]|uniref:nucleic acid dioxygenase ALKBH1 n=1 Tax=Anabrus simplex TaxID=316456 RepID=UPI0035A2B20E